MSTHPTRSFADHWLCHEIRFSRRGLYIFDKVDSSVHWQLVDQSIPSAYNYNDMKITVVIVTAISLLSLSGTSGQSGEAGAQRETLRLGMLFSQEGVFDFSGLIPTIEIALETIAADETLPFTFTYTHNDSMVRKSGCAACSAIVAATGA